MPDPSAGAKGTIATFIPKTLSSGDERSTGTREVRKYTPMTLSSDESHGEGPSQGNKLNAPSSRSAFGKFSMTPMVLSSDSEHGDAPHGKMNAGNRKFVPVTLADSDDDEDVEVIATGPSKSKSCAKGEESPGHQKEV